MPSTIAPPARTKSLRSSLSGGTGLQQLRHAVEYLTESRLFLASAISPKAEYEAVHILHRASRDVFTASTG